MPQLQENTKRFSPEGRDQAIQLVKDIMLAGGKARIGETWLDCSTGAKWETVLVYHNPLRMWYQALNPADFDAMNKGVKPPYHADIVKEAVR